MPRARGLDVASDFDGTLAPIVSHPDRSALDPRARAAIHALQKLPGVRVAVMSGRRLADLERQAALRGVFLVGTAGIETRDLQGHRRVHGRGRIPPAIGIALRAWCRRFPGAWVEDKGPGLSVHYRAVPARRRTAFTAGLKRRLALHRDAVEVTYGLRVFELRPEGSPDKAAALARWLGRSGRGRLLVYLGDDANDRPALQQVRAWGGFAIAVGRRRLPAIYRLSGPAAAKVFLEWLAAAWRVRRV